MANHKSAEKRARQAVRRNTRNTQTVSAVRTFEKKVTTAIAGGDAAGAKVALNDYMSKASKAATKGAISKKAASRKIGRMAARVSKLAAK